ncbi:ferritin-like domain-containing protein [Spiroplasma floricola]|uniref:Ferritin n=1 Tax=Spiroplasma floricola 23-6 TaxID=1336749 RepID=A0A2K8SCJ7_9MOLU|nr:ferritin-like domain-containing protein [Spiroplasma floricola]AUB31197.1 ferritin [Spiroplasma floricola 23-6]
MDKLILTNLQDYINEHIKMQLNCFNLSKKCDELGYPGFTHFFQVQAQDEFLHQRRIINYLLDRGQNYKIGSVEITTPDLKNIEDILKEYIKCRTHFANITNEFTNNAKEKMDFTTVKFYEWFSIDFYEEISETNDLLDWIKMSNGNHYAIDKKVLGRENPDTLAVVDPFAPHQD